MELPDPYEVLGQRNTPLVSFTFSFIISKCITLLIRAWNAKLCSEAAHYRAEMKEDCYKEMTFFFTLKK